jgi:hypothetical protein
MLIDEGDKWVKTAVKTCPCRRRGVSQSGE